MTLSWRSMKPLAIGVVLVLVAMVLIEALAHVAWVVSPTFATWNVGGHHYYLMPNGGWLEPSYANYPADTASVVWYPRVYAALGLLVVSLLVVMVWLCFRYWRAEPTRKSAARGDLVAVVMMVLICLSVGVIIGTHQEEANYLRLTQYSQLPR